MTGTSLKDHFLISRTSGLRHPTSGPRLIFRLRWTNLPGSTRVTGYSGSDDLKSETIKIEPGEKSRGDVLIAVAIPDGIKQGENFSARFEFECEGRSDHTVFSAVHPGNDWTCFIGAGYHVDPVWWNTQRDYTDIGSHQKHDTGAFLELNRLFLDLLKTDPEFACTIETVDALQPTWFSEPELRKSIRKFASEGRLELIGSYDEPQSTLVGCELLCRNIAYGIGFAKLISGFTPKGLAQWDVFGHDPVWPALGEAAGLKWTTFCRGLYHGGHLPADENLIPSEFRWISPDGSEHLTHYQSRHYTSGWEFPWTPVEDAEIPVLERFDQLTIPATTSNVLLPCYGDFAKPFEGMMDLVRWWNERYISPKLVLGTQDDYLNAVMKESGERSLWLPPISRDLNPAFSGCNLSFADTKQAQRLAENVLRDAEIRATIACFVQAEYPSAALDRAWRILCHTSHHDAVTGSESDQVYLDLTSLWREAYDLATAVGEKALRFLAGRVDPEGLTGPEFIKVFNSLNWMRGGPVRIDPDKLHGAGPWVAVDADDIELPVIKIEHGFELFCTGVPPLGFKMYRIEESDKIRELKPNPDRNTIENDFFLLTVDPSKGGGITSIIDKRSNREYLQPDSIANEIIVYPEYAGLEMGPWRIQTTGERLPSSGKIAGIKREIHPGRQTITSSMEFLGCIVEKTVTLRENEPFIDCTTSIRGYSDHDLMWRAEFPMNLPGTVPVAQTSGGVIGRPFGRQFGDFLVDEYFGDWAVDKWGGLECPLSFKVPIIDDEKYHSVGIGEIVIPDNPDAVIRDAVDRLVPILSRAGVTTVVTRSSARRAEAGDWTKDGSRPDFRIAFGDAESNSLIGLCVSVEPEINRNEADALWIDLDAPAPLDIPIIGMPDDPDSLNELLSRWNNAFNDRQRAQQAAPLQPSSDIVGAPLAAPHEKNIESIPAFPILDGFSRSFIQEKILQSQSSRYAKPDAGCAMLVRGTPSLQVRPDGTISLGLFRSSSGCPSGGWIDPPPTRMPDGSFFQHAHWSHKFEYRLMPHEGDWRNANVARIAEEFSHPLESVITQSFSEEIREVSFQDFSTGTAILQAYRPLDSPDTSFYSDNLETDLKRGLLVRLRELEGRESKLEGKTSGYRIERTDLTGSPIQNPDDLTIRPWSVTTFALVPENILDLQYSPYDRLRPDLLWPARYWRSSLGPAGWASQPVFHKFNVQSINLAPGEIQTVPLQITNNTTTGIKGIRIKFRNPDFVSVSLSEHSPVDLQPDETIQLPIQITCSGTIPDRGGYLTAELTDSNGFRTVAALPVNRKIINTAPAKIEIPEAVIVGDNGVDLECSINYDLEQEIEGFIELILPFEAWSLLQTDSVRQSIVLRSGQTGGVKFPLKKSADIEPGRYYAVAKLHLLEEQTYSQACWVVVPDKSGTWINSEQGRNINFSRKTLAISTTQYSTDDKVPDPIKISTSNTSGFDTSSESSGIPGGHQTKTLVQLDPSIESTPFDLLTIEASDRYFETSIELPRGQSTSVAKLSAELTLDDPTDKWVHLLDSTPLPLKFIDADLKTGPKPLSLPVRMAFTDTDLYLMAEIPWSFRLNPHRKRNIRLGDCLQIAFFPSRIVEIGFALKSDGPYPWTWNVVLDSPYPPLAPCSIVSSGCNTLIKSIIPWSLLRLENPPAALPWNLVIHTSDENHHRTGAWVLADGTVDGSTRDGLEFGCLLLQDH